MNNLQMNVVTAFFLFTRCVVHLLHMLSAVCLSVQRLLQSTVSVRVARENENEKDRGEKDPKVLINT